MNFLRQCVEQGYWADGFRYLSLPVRNSVHRLRKTLRRRQPASNPSNPRMLRAAILSNELHSAFAQPRTPAQDLTGIDLIFAEADAQIRGSLRLAGGATFQQGAIHVLPDPEQRHAFHRLYWAVRFARAAAFGHPEAASAMVADFNAWLTGAADREQLAHSAYSASERIANLGEVLFWIALDNSRGAHTIVPAVKGQIERDAINIFCNIEYALGVHNHLLNNARALYIASQTLREHPSAQQWRSKAFELWDEYFPRLILADGALAEQSSHYHVLLSRTALEYWLGAKTFGHTLPNGLVTRLRRMLRLANDLVRADGSLPRFGDNSPDQTMSDLRGLLAAAYLSNLLDEPPRDAAVTALTFYYCDSLADCPKMPAESRRLYGDGGFGFLRNEEIEIAIHGDPRAETRAHGDAGRGSFEIWWRGRAIVREPGCFLNEKDPKSNWYRSGQAQNVTCIDGLPPGMEGSARSALPSWYSANGGTWRLTPDGGLQFDCDGFRRRRPDLKVARRWRVLENGSSLEFEEEIQGQGRARFESRIFLGDSGWSPLEWDPVNRRAAISRQFDGSSRVRLVLSVPQRLTPALGTASYRPEYGVEEPTRVITLQGSCSLPTRWLMSCHFSN